MQDFLIKKRGNTINNGNTTSTGYIVPTVSKKPHQRVMSLHGKQTIPRSLKI